MSDNGLVYHHAAIRRILETPLTDHDYERFQSIYAKKAPRRIQSLAQEETVRALILHENDFPVPPLPTMSEHDPLDAPVAKGFAVRRHFIKIMEDYGVRDIYAGCPDICGVNRPVEWDKIAAVRAREIVGALTDEQKAELKKLATKNKNELRRLALADSDSGVHSKQYQFGAACIMQGNLSINQAFSDSEMTAQVLTAWLAVGVAIEELANTEKLIRSKVGDISDDARKASDAENADVQAISDKAKQDIAEAVKETSYMKTPDDKLFDKMMEVSKGFVGQREVG